MVAAVLYRQGGICLAAILDDTAGLCATMSGVAPRPHQLQLDHVRGNPPIGTLQITPQGGHGRRPPDEAQFLAAVCHRHHADNLGGGGTGWAPAHRPAMRAYLETWFAGGTVEQAVAAGKAAL